VDIWVYELQDDVAQAFKVVPPTPFEAIKRHHWGIDGISSVITNKLLGSLLTLQYDAPVIKQVHPVIPDPEALGF
jgi:hypothetical protein